MKQVLRDELELFIAKIRTLLEDHGLCLAVGNDFRHFRDIPLRQPVRPHVAPIFDPAVQQLHPEKAFWLTASTPAGEVVHTQAVQLLDLGGRTLGEHLTSQLGAYRPHGTKLDMSRSLTRQTTATSDLKGRICYHGELWIKGGKNGYRGGSLTALLPRLMLAMTMHKWQPDYIFGVMEPGAACRGLAAREGYMHLEQGSVLWHDPGSSEPFEEWIVWLGKQDIPHLLAVEPARLFAMFENERMFTPAFAQAARKIA
jgi:hypothetical protein